MLPKSPKIFLDTSVIIAAVMSPTGGARLLFHLSQAGVIHLIVGKGVLIETEEVLRRKAPSLMGLLAQLLEETNIEISSDPTVGQQKRAQSLPGYLPDANVLAQALAANPDWFVSHDREHFLGNPTLTDLAFQMGAPGDVIVWLRNQTE
jgi:predicted nucleic acid-binding protein